MSFPHLSLEYKSVVALQHRHYILIAGVVSTPDLAKENAMSSFSNQYPEYRTIEQHIRRAHAERSIAIAHALATAVEATVRGLKRLVGSLGDNMQAEHERRLIQADSFLRRSIPHR
jgi:hypothetical protein